MKELLPTITEITKHGLQPNLEIADKEKLLEINLVTIYYLYFNINYKFDNTDYTDFNRLKLPNIRKNVASNFKHFGFYKKMIYNNNIECLNENAIGDAIDDLTDIITDLLEVKWRIENNSLADGMWFFEFTFRSHIQLHMLDLLKYMKQKND